MSMFKKEELEFGDNTTLTLCRTTEVFEKNPLKQVYIKISGKTVSKELTITKKIIQIFKLIFTNSIDAEIVWYPSSSITDKNISGYNEIADLTESIIKFME